MIRRIIDKAPFALAALFLLASCNNEDYEQEINTKSEKIRFEITVGTATATSDEAQTRVETSIDGKYTCKWNDGDEIGVYIVKGGNGLHPIGNWVDNMEMTYNDGNWTYTLPNDKEYYPMDGDELHFYAYYPFIANLSDATNIDFSVELDQGDAANLSKSDLLMATTFNISKSSNPVQLVFSHALTMVEVKANSGTSDGDRMSEDVTVTLENCLTNAALDLSTGVTTARGNATAVTMQRIEQPTDDNYATSYTYRAFIPAQKVEATDNTELISFTKIIGSVKRPLTHKLSESVIFENGKVKLYNITLDATEKDHVYKFGDYYPSKGFVIFGVVFETSDDGKSGKIMGLDQKYAAWGPSNDEDVAGVEGIKSLSDGFTATKNLIRKYKDTPTFDSSYSAFSWIHSTMNQNFIDGNWYIPALNELDTLEEIWNTKSSDFNSAITNAGGVSLSNYIWTSSEKNSHNAYVISIDQFTFYKGIYIFKLSIQYVRAIARF